MSEVNNEIEKKIHEFAEQMYKVGYEEGHHDGEIDCIMNIHLDDFSYQRGIEEAWECVRKIFNASHNKIIGIFGKEREYEYVYYDIINEYSASEAIAKIKEYEEKQTEKSCNTCGNEYVGENGCKYCKRKDCDYSKSKWTLR